MIHKKILLFSLIFLITGGFIISCKKIELIRVAKINTGTVYNITSSTAMINAEIIDLGEGSIKRYGFCWSNNIVPTLNSSYKNLGVRDQVGQFSTTIENLESGANYFIRSFLENETGLTYGNTISFDTESSGHWLTYTDETWGWNIGFTYEDYIDIAIRFNSTFLQPYDGFKISKIKFFVHEGYIYYSVEVGDNPDAYSWFYDPVENPVIDDWTTYYFTTPIYIDASKGLWAGLYFHNYPDYHPVTTDHGPAVSGYGDLYSDDGGVNWYSISTDANWNILVFVTNDKGQELELTKNTNIKEKMNYKEENQINKDISSLPNIK